MSVGEVSLSLSFSSGAVAELVALSQRFQKFCPVEAYPLIAFVVAMSSFGITYGVRAFNVVPGEVSFRPFVLISAPC